MADTAGQWNSMVVRLQLTEEQQQVLCTEAPPLTGERCERLCWEDGNLTSGSTQEEK